MTSRLLLAFVSTLALVALATLFAGCGDDSPPDVDGCLDESGHLTACPDAPAPSVAPTK